MKSAKFLLLPSLLTLVTRLVAQTVIEPSEPSGKPIELFQDFAPALVGATRLSSEDFVENSPSAIVYFYNTASTAGLVKQSATFNHQAVEPLDITSWSRWGLNHPLFAGNVRPFVAINAGRIYGSFFRDNWTAGLESGAKFYMRPQTYLRAAVEYGWLFETTDDLDNRFKDGLWNWSVAVGFSF